VTPSPVGIPTPPAVDLIDNSCLYVTAPIDEVDAPAIRAGMPAKISLDAFPRENFTGTVRRVAPYVLDLEKQARTVEIEVEVAQLEELELLAGYSADVEVVLQVRENVLRVPTQSVLEDSTVLLYSDIDGVLESRSVKLGVANWEYTEIESGLKAGDRIRLVSMDDPDPIPAGTAGTVVGVSPQSDWTQVDVDWDNGRSLMLSIPPDSIQKI